MDTPIVIIILAYIASFCLLGIQAVVADPLNIEMVGADGVRKEVKKLNSC
jgi:hypothetical protein